MYESVLQITFGIFLDKKKLYNVIEEVIEIKKNIDMLKNDFIIMPFVVIGYIIHNANNDIVEIK
jgi:hypothetical protein